MRLRAFIVVTMLLGGLTLGARAASAAPLDCTAGCFPQAYGGALWSTTSVQPSGTGVIDPFVRLQALGGENSEQGMNTDVATSFQEKAGIWTHDLKFSDVPIVSSGGVQYYEFLLDIAEPSAAGKSTVSLDGVKICLSDVGDQYNSAGGGCTTANAIQKYTLDTSAGGSGNRAVMLDYNFIGGGNGNSDLFMYIPVATLGLNAGSSQYLYLWSQFGLIDYSDASFEEWAVRKSGGGGGGGVLENGTVPEPTSVVLLATGLGLVLARRLRGRRQA